MYLQGQTKADKIAKVIKTTNYLNRLLLEQENDFMLGKRKGKQDIKHADVQCNLMQETVKIVEKEVFIEVPTKAIEQAPAVEDEPEFKGDIVQEFFDIVRTHCIQVLMRENPD